MSELNDLITKLCPDGVPYKKLDDLADIGTGSSNTQDQEPDGIYPFYVRSPEVKRSSSFEFDETAVITAGDGDVGKIFHFVEGKYALHQRAYRIKPTSSSLNAKFLYYYMKANFRAYVERKACSATVKSLRKPMFQNFEIPVPPLPVQAEIVRILDSFTTLEAELEAELADRKKQYEYYRDYLLDKNTLERMDGKPVEMKKLGDICIRQRGTRITAKQMKEIACVNGDILIFGGGKTKVYAKKSDIPSKDIITCPSVVVKSRGNIGFEYCDVPFTHKSELWSYSSNDEAVNIKFISYYLENNRRFFQDAANIGKLPQISTGVTDNYNVPVPSLATQERVVDILDRFDTLTTSLTDGIPAEIAMRREQYEYCRSRLLDFPHLPDGSASVSDSE